MIYHVSQSGNAIVPISFSDKKEKKVKLVSSEYVEKEEEPIASKKKSKNKFKGLC